MFHHVSGPDFLKQPEDSWPIEPLSGIDTVADTVKFIGTAVTTLASEEQILSVENDNLAERIDIERTSKLQLLFNTTARVLKMYEK